MKIKISITLDVNVENWMLTYGITRKEVRKNVKNHFECYCLEELKHIDCENNSEERL